MTRIAALLLLGALTISGLPFLATWLPGLFGLGGA